MPRTPSSKLQGGGTARPPGHVAIWIAVLLAAMSPGSWAQDESTAALWKTQEIAFTYGSSRAIYSCGALRGRVESVLRAVGADADLQVSVSNCQTVVFPEAADLARNNSSRSLFGRSTRSGLENQQFTQVRIRLRSPIPATPEAIAEVDKAKGYRELLGRVTGNTVAIEESVAQFPARREEVSLSYKTLRLEPEECELLEQMIREVFPKLGVRVLETSMSCGPRQTTMLKPRIKVEALIRVPPADQSRGEVRVGEAVESEVPVAGEVVAPAPEAPVPATPTPPPATPTPPPATPTPP